MSNATGLWEGCHSAIDIVYFRFIVNCFQGFDFGPLNFFTLAVLTKLYLSPSQAFKTRLVAGTELILRQRGSRDDGLTSCWTLVGRQTTPLKGVAPFPTLSCNRRPTHGTRPLPRPRIVLPECRTFCFAGYLWAYLPDSTRSDYLHELAYVVQLFSTDLITSQPLTNMHRGFWEGPLIGSVNLPVTG